MPLIFMHINKTAGTSLRSLVEQNYDSANTLLLYPTRVGMSLDNFHRLSEQEKSAFSVVYGHISYGIHKHWKEDSSYVCILRNPVERTLSAFAHHLRNPLSQEFHKLPESERSLERFLDLELVGTDNLMTRMLSGVRHVRFGECTKSHLELACENLERHFLNVLFQESLTKDTELLAKQLGWEHQNLPVLNISTDRILLEQCSKYALEKLADLNSFDQQLYEFAQNRKS